MDVLFFRPQPLSCSQSLYYSRLQSSLPISSLMKRVLNVMRSPKLAHIFVDSVWTPRPIVGNLNFSNGKRLGSRHCFTSPLQTPSPKSRFSRLFSEMFRRRSCADHTNYFIQRYRGKFMFNGEPLEHTLMLKGTTGKYR